MAQGTSVGIVIAVAPVIAQVAVPDVRGMTCEEAKVALGSVQLNGTCEEGEDGGKPDQAGRAYDSTPSRGSVVAEATAVTVYTRPGTVIP